MIHGTTVVVDNHHHPTDVVAEVIRVTTGGVVHHPLEVVDAFVVEVDHLDAIIHAIILAIILAI